MNQPIENPILFEADDYYENDNRTADQVEIDGLKQEIDRLNEDLLEACGLLERVAYFYKYTPSPPFVDDITKFMEK